MTGPVAGSGPFAECGQSLQRLDRGLKQLEHGSSMLQLPPLAGREWYELLTRKLLPQVVDGAYLVVAVTGGTNIGKSVIFNHLAGARFSATSPLASGTRHPVLLVPSKFPDRHQLEVVFPGFELHAWTSAQTALEESDTSRLFWREQETLPENLLLLDTPDIDSDARVNWERADHIRQCADVLIAVLTQQKYNDAAVKQFFRKSAQEQKVVIVVFNQCLLPEDEEFWPLWLNTFCEETGVAPQFVYLAPNDRRAAEELKLPFLEREWPPGGERPAASQPRELRADLSRLRFDSIKIQTLQGSLAALLSEDTGVRGYLREIAQRSREFANAAALLTDHRLAELDNWPVLPQSLLIEEIRHWWRSQRQGWSARVHEFYNTLGTGVAWPVRFARRQLQGEPEPPIEQYRREEWDAILVVVESVYRTLRQVAELGNPLLQPRLERLLGGKSRAELVQTLQHEHARCDLLLDLQRLVAEELETFRRESPQFYSALKRVDSVAAAFRPATSVVLFMTGVGPAGDAAMQLAAHSAFQSIAHVVGDVAGGTVVAAVGETAISKGASTGAGIVEAHIRRLHQRFSQKRAAWLAGMLQTHLWGGLPEELVAAAQLPDSSIFKEVIDAVDDLSRQLALAAEEAVS